MNRARTLTTFRAADEASNRFQEHVKEVLNPVLRELGSPQAWQAPTLINGWANFGGSNPPVGYMKDALGFVHLRGMASAGTVGATMFTLPAGYASAYTFQGFAVVSNGAFGYLTVDSGGNVVLQAGSNAYVRLDGVNFDTRLR